MIPLYAFATSFCALAYQQLMAYALMDATSNFVLSQSVTLGVFLFAMGVGSLRAERGGKLGWRRLLRVELIIGLLGILSIGFVQVSEILVAYLALPHANAALLLINTPYLFAIGYHTGLEVPCLLQEDGNSTRTLANNYFGAFTAAIAVPLLCLPFLDVSSSTILFGLLNLMLAAGLVQWPRVKPLAWLGVTGLLTLITAWTMIAPKLRDFHLKFVYVHPEYEGLAQLPVHWNILKYAGTPLRQRTRYQWIDLLPRAFAERLGGDAPLVLFLDRHLQFSSGSFRRYHESMVRGGVGFLGRTAQRILIIGGGDGLLAAEIARSQPRPERVDLVELDAAMLKLCQRDLGIRELGGNVFENAPWLKVHIADGFQFIRESQDTYDLIMIDLPFPVNYDLSLLYSKEFYTLVRRRLAPDGIMIFDFPAVEKNISPSHAILLQTVGAAGFSNPLAFGAEEMFVAAASDGRPLKLNPLAFGEMNKLTAANLVSFEKEVAELMRKPAPVNSIFFPRVLAESR